MSLCTIDGQVDRRANECESLVPQLAKELCYDLRQDLLDNGGIWWLGGAKLWSPGSDIAKINESISKTK